MPPQGTVGTYTYLVAVLALAPVWVEGGRKDPTTRDQDQLEAQE